MPILEFTDGIQLTRKGWASGASGLYFKSDSEVCVSNQKRHFKRLHKCQNRFVCGVGFVDNVHVMFIVTDNAVNDSQIYYMLFGALFCNGETVPLKQFLKKSRTAHSC